MSDAYTTRPVEDGHAVCWGAILAGGFAAAGVTLIFIALGTGAGFAMVSPWENSGASATTLKWTGGAYLLLTAIISSAIGGYIAGRLRTRWAATTHSEEVLFRDTAHGLVAWAFATVVGVLVLGAASTHFLAATGSGAAQGAAQAGAQSASTDYFVDTLLRPAPGGAAGGSTTAPSGTSMGVAPAAGSSSQPDSAASRREVSLILTRGFASGSEFPAADRTYLAQLVSSRTGLSQADAEARVNDVLTKTKEYLDSARKHAIAVAMWLTLSLFAGAFAAAAAAIEGGQLRDGRWRGVIFARGYQSQTVR